MKNARSSGSVRSSYASITITSIITSTKQAVALFTPDVDWLGLGVRLVGREEILEGLYGGLGAGTIRHVMTSVVVNVIDEDHAESRVYGTLFSSPDIRYDQHEGPNAFEGPMQFVDGAGRIYADGRGLAHL